MTIKILFIRQSSERETIARNSKHYDLTSQNKNVISSVSNSEGKGMLVVVVKKKKKKKDGKVFASVRDDLRSAWLCPVDFPQHFRFKLVNCQSQSSYTLSSVHCYSLCSFFYLLPSPALAGVIILKAS